MKTFRSAFLAAAFALLAAGCGMGAIYTRTVQPLTLDVHNTPVVGSAKEGDIKHLVLIYGPLSVAWDSNAIGDIARKNDLEEIYFADIEMFSVLGIWHEYRVHVYGK